MATLRTYSRKRFMGVITSDTSSPFDVDSSQGSDAGSQSQEDPVLVLCSEDYLLDEIYDNSQKTFDLPIFDDDEARPFEKRFFGLDWSSRKKRKSTEKPAKETEESKQRRRADALQRSARKSTFQLQEEADFSALRDELEFIVDGLGSGQPLGVRRSSAYNLAKLCKARAGAVGQQLRALGDVGRDVFDRLDASLADPVVALGTALVAYFLLRDSVNAEYATAQLIQLLIRLVAGRAAPPSDSPPSGSLGSSSESVGSAPTPPPARPSLLRRVSNGNSSSSNSNSGSGGAQQQPQTSKLVEESLRRLQALYLDDQEATTLLEPATTPQQQPQQPQQPPAEQQQQRPVVTASSVAIAALVSVVGFSQQFAEPLKERLRLDGALAVVLQTLQADTATLLLSLPPAASASVQQQQRPPSSEDGKQQQRRRRSSGGSGGRASAAAVKGQQQQQLQSPASLEEQPGPQQQEQERLRRRRLMGSVCSCLRIVESATFCNEANKRHCFSPPLTAALLRLVSAAYERLATSTMAAASTATKRRQQQGGDSRQQPDDDDDDDDDDDEARGQHDIAASSTAGSSSSSGSGGQQWLEVLQAALKVLINLTNDNDLACTSLAQDNGLQLLLTLLGNALALPEEGVYDVEMLLLGLLINLVEVHASNRSLFRSLDVSAIRSRPKNSLHMLVQSYLAKSAAAAIAASSGRRTLSSSSSSTGGLRALSSSSSSSTISGSESTAETETKIATSYVAVLLGLLARDSRNKELILQDLPLEAWGQLIDLIEEFVLYQLQAGILSKQAYDFYCSVLQSMRD